MIAKQKNLAKILIIYQWLWMTDNPTSAVKKAVNRLQRAFRGMMKNEPKMFEEARKEQIKLYAEAWANTSEDEDGRSLSVGKLVTALYDTCDHEQTNKWIGKRIMEKVLESYYFANGKEGQEARNIQIHADQLVDELIRLFDGTVKLSPLALKIKIQKDNALLEGKDPNKYLEIKDEKTP